MTTQIDRTVSFVVLVKETSIAKTRLTPDRSQASEIARRLALRTIERALRARCAVEVVVVTGDAEVAQAGAVLGAVIVPEARPLGMNAAAALGRRRARALHPHAAVAVLVADLPHLTSEELDGAFCEFVERGQALFVADHTAEGTTLLIHGGNARLGIAFGRASAHMHRRLGYVEARRPLRGLRMDLDRPEDMKRVQGVPLTPVANSASRRQ